MSLASLLQSYSEDISARENHNNELADSNASRKAQSNEDKFDSYLSSLNQGAVDLGSASSAFHLGRKVYKKFQTGKKVVKQLQELVDQRKAEVAGESDKPTGEEGDAVKDSEPKASDSANDDAGKVADDTIEPPARPGVPKRDLPDEAFGKQARKFQNRANKLQDQFEQSKAPAAPAEEASVPTKSVESADAPATQSVSNAPQGEPSPAARAEPEEPDFITSRKATPLQESREGAVQESDATSSATNRNTADNTGERGAVNDGETAPNERVGLNGSDGARVVENTDEDVGALQRAGAAVQDTVTGVKEAAGNMAKQVGTKTASAIKNILPESIGNFLESGAGVGLEAGLDAIPVVGEVASVITGLVSLFTGLDHKDKDDTTQVSDAPVGQVATGIDPTALTKNQAATATIV